MDFMMNFRIYFRLDFRMDVIMDFRVDFKMDFRMDFRMDFLMDFRMDLDARYMQIHYMQIRFKLDPRYYLKFVGFRLKSNNSYGFPPKLSGADLKQKSLLCRDVVMMIFSRIILM